MRWQSGTECRHAGFTLLEMAICLFILMLVIGMGAGLMRGALGNEILRDADRQARFMAKSARLSALRENRDFEMAVEPGFLVVRPARTLEEDGKAGEPEAEEAGESRFDFPPDVKVLVRHWGSEKWEPSGAFLFPASGLCEPAAFRFERGDAWMEFVLNPLTANPQDEGFYLP